VAPFYRLGLQRERTASGYPEVDGGIQEISQPASIIIATRSCTDTLDNIAAEIKSMLSC
jgi:hypothetical protein